MASTVTPMALARQACRDLAEILRLLHEIRQHLPPASEPDAQPTDPSPDDLA